MTTSSLLLLLLLIALLPESESTVCYLCSWSPDENRTDYCSGANWRPQMVGYIDCDSGCESVTQMDKNGVVSMFFRNCANANAPRYQQCQKQPAKAGTRRVCSCNMHLCNVATALLPLPPLFLLGPCLLFLTRTHP